MVGYSEAELEDAQAKWGLRFPPDLVESLWEFRPLIDGRDSFDWVAGDPEDIRRLIAWPFKGYWRSVERHHIWWPECGERPASRADRKETLRSIFANAPRLIPLGGIRYIPDEPFESGNPVFSVMASDIIHDAANIADWIERSRGGLLSQPRPRPAVKEIRFWGQAVRYSEDENSPVRRQIAAGFAARKRDRR
jgi:hypothetical protein